MKLEGKCLCGKSGWLAQHCIVVLIATTVLSAGIAAASDLAQAKQPLMNPELMEELSGVPAINLGSDGELTLLPAHVSALNSAMIENGTKLYHTHCAACHGKQLQGQPNPDVRLPSGLLPAPAHDETGHTWHHADDQLFEIVKYGATVAMGDPEYRSSMPPFSDVLDDNSILSILVFIRSTWPERLRKWQAGANAAQTGKRWWLQQDK